MTEKEDNAWWYLMGLMMGLIFTPFAETVWWKIGAFVLIAWAILRREKDVKGSKQENDRAGDGDESTMQ